MHHIATNLNCKITPDGARLGFKWVGCPNNFASRLDDAGTFPDHADNRARKDVFNKGREERFALEVLIVLLSDISSALEEFQAKKLESFAFKAGNDLTDEATLDTCARWTSRSKCRSQDMLQIVTLFHFEI